mmetsp:Transcript_856/g.1991  ORF Transcript_856/g.1991 Transcript_856/m.1991 type:complete len:192 (-) Transcript_856:90-665(-)
MDHFSELCLEDVFKRSAVDMLSHFQTTSPSNSNHRQSHQSLRNRSDWGPSPLDSFHIRKFDVSLAYDAHRSLKSITFHHQDQQCWSEEATFPSQSEQSTPSASPCAVGSDRSTAHKIYPRRKPGENVRRRKQDVVEVNEDTLTKLFGLPIHQAAETLGIGATAMKAACRRLGIKKWPYVRGVSVVKSGLTA